RNPEQRLVNPFGQFALLESLGRARITGRVLFGLLVFNLERIRMGAFSLELPVVVDDVIAANPDHPCHERPGFWPVRTEGPIDLQEEFLSKVFGFLKPSRETVRQVIDPLGILMNDHFPGAMVAGPASSYQLRIGCLQPVLAPSASATTLPH